MAKKNPLIEELRNLGVTDYQRRQIRQLEKQFQQSNAYKKIEDRNLDLLGERIRPVTLNYDTALRLLQYNMFGNIQGVIKEYKTAYLMVEQGTTQEYEEYLDKLTDELQDIGVFATRDKLRIADMKKVEYWYGEYKRYENSGNGGGMEHARQELNSIVGE